MELYTFCIQHFCILHLAAFNTELSQKHTNTSGELTANKLV